MDPPRVRCVLVVANGPSRLVGPNGVLIGRRKDCDIVTLDPSVSRRHALVRLTSSGAEVVPLGRAPVELNGKPRGKAHELADGDVIDLPGLTLSVEIAARRPDASAAASYRLERARGGSFGIVHSPFVVGGDDADDLIVKRWPARALVLHVAQGELFVDVTSGKALRNGIEITAGVLEPLAVDDELVYRKETFFVRQSETHVATTAIGGLYGLPGRVTIEILPRGGRVVFGMSDGDHAVFLHDRRLDMMMALLKPPDGYHAGDYIPDDAVCAIVWPRKTVSRPEVNMLISRCRKDLIEAGLAGPRLIQRAPGGGGTRIALAPNAEVIVQ